MSSPKVGLKAPNPMAGGFLKAISVSSMLVQRSEKEAVRFPFTAPTTT